MEKINTPLMQSIERKKKRIEQLRDEYNDHDMQYPKPVNRMQQVLAKLGELTLEIEHDKSLLSTEREVIEKAFIQACHDSQNFDMDLSDDSELEHYASDHFTQTFKIYE